MKCMMTQPGAPDVPQPGVDSDFSKAAGVHLSERMIGDIALVIA